MRQIKVLSGFSQSLLVNPSTNNITSVADASGFEVGAVVQVSATGQPTKTAIVSAINGNQITLSPQNGGYVDLTAYTTYVSATINQLDQILTIAD